MTTTGNYIERIIKLLATLQVEMSLNGKISYLNINKQAEKLFRDVLAAVFHFPLENFNYKTEQFPGVDIGNRGMGLAFQITSENTSEKINDTLKKAVDHGLTSMFSRIVIFLLKDKKRSYTIKPIKSTVFVFNKDTDIMDFRDLTKMVENLPDITIKGILQHLEEQLVYPEFMQSAKSEGFNFLIDVEHDLGKSRLTYFDHFAVKLRIEGVSLSAPTLQRHFQKELNTDYKCVFLKTFNQNYQQPDINTKELKYEIKLRDTGLPDHFKHSILSFRSNEIQFEFSHYHRNKDPLSNLNEEIGGLLTLLIMLKSIPALKLLKVVTEIVYNSNCQLYFINVAGSILQISGPVASYVLDPPIQIHQDIWSTEPDELFDLLQEIANHFVLERGVLDKAYPYMTLDEDQQKAGLNNFKNRVGPVLSDF